MEPTCENCGNPIIYSGRGRRPIKFCSRKCKDAAKQRERRAAVLEAVGERRCAVCGTVLPESVHLDAKCCSPKCRVTYSNRKRAAAKLEAIKNLNRKCERCGEPIPVDRHGATKFCSARCKKLTQDDRWRAKSPGYMRGYLYGLTEDQYSAMLEDQGNACAICGSTEWPGKGNRPHVDHNHETGRVRGILCGRCNIALGHMDDDPARLRAAADYLERK